MKQQALPLTPRAPRPAKSRGSQASHFSAANAEAASVILANPEAYGGEGSLPLGWARVVEKKAPEGAR